MTIKAKVIGSDRLRKKFQGLPDKAVKHLRQAVAVSAKQVESDIQRSMRGPKSGIVYKRKSTTHQASAPGEAPAIDTGILRSSIAAKVTKGGLSATIGVHDVTKVKYARRLEFGFVGTDSKGRTYNQAARPFVFPAFEQNKKDIKNRMRRAIRAAEKEAAKKG